jgi:hypothetical protein
MTVITPISPLRRYQAHISLKIFQSLALVRRYKVLMWMYRAFYWLLRTLHIASPERRKEPAPFQDLEDLKFIHFARWTIVKPKDLHESLRDHYLVFSTNFNGDWHQYLDAFSFTLRSGLDWIWYTSRGYPGAWPVTPFKEYARRHMLPASYYYNAYPGASVRDIQCARDLTCAFEEFRVAASGDKDDPAAFRDKYDTFVARVQGDLGSCSVPANEKSVENAFR